MKKLSVFIIPAIFVLYGCGGIQLHTLFNPKEAEYINVKGENSIKGTAYIIALNGDIITCAGSAVALFPVNDYSNELFTTAYGNSNYGLATNYPTFSNKSNDFIRLIKNARCDEKGIFEFSNLADGEYYIESSTRYRIGLSSKIYGGAVMKRVKVSDGKLLLVKLLGDTQVANVEIANLETEKNKFNDFFGLPKQEVVKSDTKSDSIAKSKKEPLYKVGDTVNPVNIKVIVDIISKLDTKKDEYETKAAYEQRLASYKAKLSPHYVVFVPIDKDKVSYDAENRVLNIDYSAIGIENSRQYAVLMKIFSATKVTGTYKASNAYGANIDVTQIHEDSIYVVDKREDHPDTYNSFNKNISFSIRRDVPAIFVYNGTDNLVSFKDIESSIAKSLKNNINAAIVFSLKSPFYTKDKGFHTSPTFQNPLKIDEDEIDIYADINSVLILQGKKVIEVIMTR